MPVLPIGESDFRNLRRQNFVYVDKTAWIREILLGGAVATLFTRPRRFGKTLNLSSLRYFVEPADENREDLFSGLEVWESEAARAHFQRHPVIWVSLKDAKGAEWTTVRGHIAARLAEEFGRHRALRDALPADERECFDAVLARTTDDALLGSSLRDLSRWLHQAHGTGVVVLIDEYDTPIHSGYAGGFFPEAVGLLRSLLSGALKDNPVLHRGVLTGVLRVAKENLSSGLNNLSVFGVLDEDHATAFGFTEAEVARLAALVDGGASLGELRDWYNGYQLGGQAIYNPWSILSCLARPGGGPQPYWVSTSSNELLTDVLLHGGEELAHDVEGLLVGEERTRPIYDTFDLRALRRNPDATWSLLVHAGYLTAVESVRTRDTYEARLRIPNREVRVAFARVAADWLSSAAGGGARVERLTRAMLEGDAEAFEDLLSALVLRALSFHDVGGDTPEAVYQAFALGLLVQMEPRWRVRSNPESGHGRADLLITPSEPGRPGAVLELKRVRSDRGETTEAALDSAERQIRDRRYAEELRAAGASPVRAWAVVFDGKRVHARLLH